MFIVADSIWGTKIGLIIAIASGIIELIVAFVKDRVIDKFVLLDIGLIFCLGMVSILLENDIFFKLKPGGTLIMEHPDLDGCIAWYLQNKKAIQTPIGELNMGFTQFYGNQWDELDYETHRYVWTKAEMQHVLEEIGFEIMFLDNHAIFHEAGRDMRVVARKPF